MKGNILALIHLRVLLLSNYEISSIYEYPVWRQSCAKQLKLEKRGDALRNHPGIKNLIKKKSFRLISIKNSHSKEYTYRHHFTKFYCRIFKIFKIMFFMDGTQKKWNCRGKLLHTHRLLFLCLWDQTIVTNHKKLLNSYIWHSGCLITK